MTTATKTRRPRKSPEERAAQRRELSERLDAFLAGLAQLDEEDAVHAVIARLEERYSERNAQLIVMQCPEATEVRPFGGWREYGRKVRKGEKGLQILAPAGQREADAETDTKARQFFRIAYVFDISQTDPIDES